MFFKLKRKKLAVNLISRSNQNNKDIGNIISMNWKFISIIYKRI